MSKRNKFMWRGLCVALTLLCVVSVAVGVCAASEDVGVPALSQELVDSYPVRALKYLGYDVDGLLEAGLLYQDAGLDKKCPKKYRSPIYYSGDSYGTQMKKDSTTTTGWAPWLENMEKRGMDCTAFAAYYYFNYLRNIEGLPMDDMWNDCFKNYQEGHPNYYKWDAPRCVSGWIRHSNIAVEKGYGRLVGDSYEDLIFAMNGDLLVYYNAPADDYTHVAIYIGQYNGEHYAAHIAGRGPEITRISPDSKYSAICAIYSFECAQASHNTEENFIDNMIEADMVEETSEATEMVVSSEQTEAALPIDDLLLNTIREEFLREKIRITEQLRAVTDPIGLIKALQTP